VCVCVCVEREVEQVKAYHVGFTCTTIKIVGPFRKCGTWSFSPPFFFVRFSLPLILAIYSMEKMVGTVHSSLVMSELMIWVEMGVAALPDHEIYSRYLRHSKREESTMMMYDGS